jgi:hypothetical protein
MPLLTITEAAEKLRTTKGAARGVLDRLKVKPFNLGPGRGLGLRWDSYEVDEALSRSREPRQKPAPKRNIIHHDLFDGRPMSELVAELTSKRARI